MGFHRWLFAPDYKERFADLADKGDWYYDMLKDERAEAENEEERFCCAQCGLEIEQAEFEKYEERCTDCYNNEMWGTIYG